MPDIGSERRVRVVLAADVLVPERLGNREAAQAVADELRLPGELVVGRAVARCERIRLVGAAPVVDRP